MQTRLGLGRPTQRHAHAVMVTVFADFEDVEPDPNDDYDGRYPIISDTYE